MNRLLFLFVFLIVFSCKKKDEIVDNTIASTPPLTFYYKDFIPDTLFSIPYNANTSNAFSLQISNDSSINLRFNIYHHFIYNGPNVVNGYRNTITSFDSISFIKNYYACNSGQCMSPLDSNIYIKPYLLADSSLSLLWQEPPYISCYCYNFKNYIGFILQKNGIKRLGWVKLNTQDGYKIYVDAIALCDTPADSIKLGQH